MRKVEKNTIVGTSKIGFHHGAALLNLAKTYSTLSAVLLECIQNALDSHAPNVWVTVNFKQRTASVRDNGCGVSPEQFERALMSISQSVKKSDDLGQFGLGLISPLGVAEQFTFTASPFERVNEYRCWTFVREELHAQETLDSIPFKNVPELFFSVGGTPQRGKTSVNWKAEVLIKAFTKDKTMTKLTVSEFRDAVLERYGERMKKTKTTVHIKVVSAQGDTYHETAEPIPFTGERLPIVSYVDVSCCGETKFELFVALKTTKGRRGKVSFGIKYNDYRIGAKEFLTHCRSLVEPEIFDILTSGNFEGNVISEKCTLLENRKCFVENDALVAFCIHLSQWVHEVGLKRVQELDDLQQDERYQALGLRSLRTLENMLTLPGFESLMGIVKKFKFGTIGPGHAGFEATKKKQEQKTLSTDGGSGGEKQKKKEGKGPETPKKDHPGHVPGTVSGPRGARRKIVRGHSTGLQFAYEEMPGESTLWKFDDEYGILSFNVRHPLWADAEKSDAVLVRFQEHIAIEALHIHALPSDWRQIARTCSDEKTPAVLFLTKQHLTVGRRKMTATTKRE